MSQPPPPGPDGKAPTRRLSIDDLGLAAAPDAAAAESANAFLYAWFQLFKTAQIHSIDNQALGRPVQQFAGLVGRTIAREGRLSFQAKERALFLNSVKLKLSSEEYELAYDVFEFFEERGMGGFVIDGSLDSEAVRELLRLLVYAAPAQRRFAALDSALRQSGLCFRINKTLAGAARSSAEVALERRAYAFLTYSKLVVLYRGLLAEDRPSPHRRQFLMKKIARTVQALVDICMEDDHTFLGVASVKSGEGYAAHHAANTAVLSIALGEKLGLDKVQLADLGLAAVFSDVGLRQVPPSILDKTAPLTPEERALLDTHPLRSVEFLLGEGVFSKSVLARIVVAFEHHQCPDGSGYPAHSRAPDIFSRMVSIAEEYDALTTERPWRRALLPDEALGAMLAGSVRRFDGALLKVFANTIGLYPVGTLVRLTTGALAVVVYGGGDGERATRPIVAPLGPDGRPSGTLDLITRDVSGAYVAGVVSAEDPVRYGLQPSALFALSAPV